MPEARLARLETDGLSPKLIASVVTQVVGLVASIVATGDFDTAQITQVVILVVSAVAQYRAGLGQLKSVDLGPAPKA